MGHVNRFDVTYCECGQGYLRYSECVTYTTLSFHFHVSEAASISLFDVYIIDHILNNFYILQNTFTDSLSGQYLLLYNSRYLSNFRDIAG